MLLDMVNTLLLLKVICYCIALLLLCIPPTLIANVLAIAIGFAPYNLINVALKTLFVPFTSELLIHWPVIAFLRNYFKLATYCIVLSS